MKSVLFSSFDNLSTTGARYAERLMRESLLENYKCTFLNSSSFQNVNPLIFAGITYAANKLYDLTIASDNYIPCDMLYVQPHAGGNVKFPWFDSMTFRQKNTPISLRILEPLARHTYKSAFLMGNSMYTNKLLEKEFQRPSALLYPPVPTQLYESFQNYNRNDEIITLSSLNPRKNLEVLPLVAAFLPGKYGLIGYAVPEHREIVDRLEQNFSMLDSDFHFYASLPNKEKALKLMKTKVYLHPTIEEPFGIAIVEAMAAGCIPIVHDSGGPVEFVPEEYRYKTIEEAATKIRLALKSWCPEESFRMHSIAMRFTEQDFKRRFIDNVENLLGH